MTVMQWISDPQAELTFGNLDLAGENTFEGQIFELRAQMQDADWGNPEPIEVWVRAMLQDGSLGTLKGHDVRTGGIYVQVRADDGNGLAAGEAALSLACLQLEKTLQWLPPDGVSPVTVFDVQMARLKFITDGVAELRKTRTYRLELVCHPFTRSLEESFEQAEPATGAAAPSMLDDCTATTNWSSRDGTVSVYSGQAVMVTVGNLYYSISLIRTATLNLSDATRPYIRVKWGASSKSVRLSAMVGASGVYTSYDPIASQGGYSWFEIPDAVYSMISFTIESTTASDLDYFRVWSIEEVASVGLGTRRELARTLAVGGSARTMGRLVVSHASNGLGNVLVYTYPSDGLDQYSPPLAPFRTGGGGQTVTATNVSGTRETLNLTPTYTIPASNLPAGTYRIVARMRHTSAAAVTIAWNAAAAGITVSGSGKVTFDVANTWQYVTIDIAYLPPVRLSEASDKTVVFKLDPNGAAPAGVELDAAWLFHVDGVLTMVAAGSEKTVTIESASPEFPAGMLWVDDHYPGTSAIGALGQHNLTPPIVLMHTVTDNTEDASVGLYHFRRWHTHAGN